LNRSLSVEIHSVASQALVNLFAAGLLCRWGWGFLAAFGFWWWDLVEVWVVNVAGVLGTWFLEGQILLVRALVFAVCVGNVHFWRRVAWFKVFLHTATAVVFVVVVVVVTCVFTTCIILAIASVHFGIVALNTTLTLFFWVVRFCIFV